MELPDNVREGFVYFVDKPLEWTSFDVVRKIKYEFKRKFKSKKYKVGHAGTLDPLATGVLIVCTGKKTKTINDMLVEDKRYTATIKLGCTTPSFDAETEEENHLRVEEEHVSKIDDVLKSFIGEQLQTPPVFSAKKINGETAYNLARKGVEVEMKKSLINIKEINKISFNNNILTIDVLSSKGTYIRSLAHDIGVALGCGAYLVGLIRTQSGTVRLEECMSLEECIKGIHDL